MTSMISRTMRAIGSIIDIVPNTDYAKHMRRGNDMQRLGSDWKRIGNDMRKVIADYDSKGKGTSSRSASRNRQNVTQARKIVDSV